MPLLKEEQFDESLVVVNKKINEIKKKIQLSGKLNFIFRDYTFSKMVL